MERWKSILRRGKKNSTPKDPAFWAGVALMSEHQRECARLRRENFIVLSVDQRRLSSMLKEAARLMGQD